MVIIGVAAWLTGVADPSLAADGSWTTNASGNWSATNNWSAGTIADGVGATATFTNNITAARTATVDAVSRTLGTLTIGDADASHSFVVAANGGARLIFDNGGATAQVNQAATSKGDAISAPLALADSLNVVNAATNLLTLSGAITSAVAGTRTLASVGTGSVALSGSLGNGAGALALVQNGPSLMTLNGSNTFTGGLVVKSGTVKSTVASGYGASSNLITIGDTGGSAGATLVSAVNVTNANPILVASGNAGVALLSNSVVGAFSGPITLDAHDLTIASCAWSGTLTLFGSITGVGNLTLKPSGPLFLSAVNMAGTITNAGVATYSATINGSVGSNVTALVENSAGSALTVSGTLTVNEGGTTLANSGGSVLTVSGGVNGTGNLVLNNNGALANGITISAGAVTNAGQVVNSGTGSGATLISAVIGAPVSVLQNSVSSELILSGANTCTGGVTVAAGTLRVSNASGSASGTGTLTIDNGGTLGGTGKVAGTVMVMSGGTVAPGPVGTDRGILTLSNLTWNGGGVYQCKVASIAGSGAGAGIDYDQLILTGALTAVPGGSNLVIRLDSLGQALPFETNQNYSLRVLTYGTAPGLNVDDITLDTTAFLTGGAWSLTNLNKGLYVVCLGVVSTNRNYWVGSGNWSAATNWSLGHAPQAGEDVEFNFSSLANCTVDSVTNTLGSLTLSAGYAGTVTVQTKYAGQGSFTNLAIAGDCTIHGGTVTHLANTGLSTASDCLRLTIGGNLTIGTNGQINVDGKGYAAGRGPGAAATSGQRSCGPSHGGLGGHGYYSVKPPATYGSFVEPLTLGSGGQAAGGGSVSLTVGGTTSLDGLITAKGALASGRSPGTAGGSIFLTSGSLTGNGQLIASGRGNTDGTDSSGAGGGGRVAVTLTASSTFGNVRMSAPGVRDSSNQAGAAGTVYLQAQGQAKGEGMLVIDNAGSAVSYVTCTMMPEPSAYNSTQDLSRLSAIVITNGAVLGLNRNTVFDFGAGTLRPHGFANATVMIGGTNRLSFPDPFIVSTNYRLLINTTVSAAGDWLVPSNAVLSHLSNYYAENHALGLILDGNLTLATGGVISVDACGFAPGSGAGSGSASLYGCGSSYGGMGGLSWGLALAAPTYGSVTAPTNIGSGAYFTGNGAMLLDIRGTTTVHGTLSARQAGSSPGAGGASGGCIWLRTGVLQGNGLFDASGGSTSYRGSAGNGSAGGGGGGRVSVVLTESDSFDAVRLLAAGGPNTSGGWSLTNSGAAGTIYTETLSQGHRKGRLLVANAGSALNLGIGTNTVTQLPAPSRALADELKDVTLVISNRSYVALTTNLTIGDLFIVTNTPSYLFLKGWTLTVNHPYHRDWGSTNNVIAEGGQIIWRPISTVLILQ
jgi:autotransporter-associated beta strand protein